MAISNTVTAIINGYKRPTNVDDIIISLLNQTIPVSAIYVWWNDAASAKTLRYAHLVQQVISDTNFGVWARFAFALNATTDHLVIFDDDTIPGHEWIENCLEHCHLGLLGTIGLIYNDKTTYMNHTRIGWANPNSSAVRVDIVGHSWFFKREWLSTYFRELRCLEPEFAFFGEDIHFSYSIQKYLSIPTFVPPHPLNNFQRWGSINGLLGVDQHAISMRPHAASKWDIPFAHYIKRGFRLLIDE
jgi:hypothetical protein